MMQDYSYIDLNLFLSDSDSQFSSYKQKKLPNIFQQFKISKQEHTQNPIFRNLQKYYLFSNQTFLFWISRLIIFLKNYKKIPSREPMDKDSSP